MCLGPQPCFSTPDQTSCLEYAENSAILWNQANYERTKAWHNHETMPSYASQCKTLKTNEAFKKLGTCKSQALLSKLREAWNSYYALKRLEKQGKLPLHIRMVNPPHYWKENGKRVSKVFYVRNDGWHWTNKDELVIGRMRVPFQHGRLWVGRHGRLEVLHDAVLDKWHAYFPVEVQSPPSRVAGKTASLDLGICNLAALYIENEKPIIYSGRAVLSDWVYRTKKIAGLQSELPRGKHVSKRIQLLFRSRQHRLRHAVNALVKAIFHVLEKKNVSMVVIGDLDGIRAGADFGGSGNQKLHNFWVFKMVLKRVVELGEAMGIVVRRVSEWDTSRTCCLCGKQHNGRVERGLMVCSTLHRSVNADVTGEGVPVSEVDAPLRKKVIERKAKGILQKKAVPETR